MIVICEMFLWELSTSVKTHILLERQIIALFTLIGVLLIDSFSWLILVIDSVSQVLPGNSTGCQTIIRKLLSSLFMFSVHCSAKYVDELSNNKCKLVLVFSMPHDIIKTQVNLSLELNHVNDVYQSHFRPCSLSTFTYRIEFKLLL